MKGIVALLVLLASVIPARATAHEIGKTQIAAVFANNGTYQFDVVVDPDALLTRLQILATGKPEAPASRDARDREIASLGSMFLGAVRLSFDGQRSTPRFEYRPVSAFSDLAQAPSVVRLTGAVPSGAQAFTLAYELATGTYA